MLELKGFGAWIVSDEEELDEYDIKITGDVITCWVPSKKGKKFSVCWQNDNRGKTATSGHIFVDGIDVASAIMRAERLNHVERSGAKTSTSTVRPFVFGELQLTDDERIAPVRDPSAADIGQIRLEITRVVLGAEVPFKAAVVDERGPVHERAKKAGAHVTRYGKAQRAAKGKTAAVSTAPYDVGRDKPWVTFIFRYRSRGKCFFLLAQDIIPNPALRKRAASPIIVNSDDEDGETQPKRAKLEPLEQNLSQAEAMEIDDDPDADADEDGDGSADLMDNSAASLGLDNESPGARTEDEGRLSAPPELREQPHEGLKLRPEFERERDSPDTPVRLQSAAPTESQLDEERIQETLVEESQTQDTEYESTQQSPAHPPYVKDESQDGQTMVH